MASTPRKPKIAPTADCKPLIAAVMTQAVRDLHNADLATGLDAALFIVDDFGTYSEVFGMDVDGINFLISGRARVAAINLFQPTYYNGSHKTIKNQTRKRQRSTAV